jgi:hypothetical protein
MHSAASLRIAPGEEERDGEYDYVQTVDQERGAELDELREQHGGERQDRDQGQKTNMNPGKVAIGTRQVVQLRLLGNPADPERQKAHRVHDKSRRKGKQRLPQLQFRVNRRDWRDADVEDQQGHRKGEHAIAQRIQALQSIPGDAVVNLFHNQSGAAWRACNRAPQKYLPTQRRSANLRALTAVLLIADSFCSA